MIESWKPVVGYESLYAVSNKGRVKSQANTRSAGFCGTRKYPEKIRVLSWNESTKYFVIGLVRNGAKTTRTVHSLVCEAFIGPRPVGMKVLHGKLGSCINNVTNLRYGTRSENQLDRTHDGNAYKGKPVMRSDGVRFEGMCQAARETGIHRDNISSVCSGQRSTAGGYGWSIIESEV